MVGTALTFYVMLSYFVEKLRFGFQSRFATFFRSDVENFGFSKLEVWSFHRLIKLESITCVTSEAKKFMGKNVEVGKFFECGACVAWCLIRFLLFLS